MIPFITITCLLSVAATIKADDLWGGPVYAPGHATVDYYAYPSYAFEYAVKDPHTGDDKAQWEKRHGDVVKGAYSLVEPDGSLRIVEYYADDKTGFNAVVKRLGPSLHPATVHAAPSIYKAPIPVLGSPSVAPISVGSVSKLAGLASAPLLSGPLVGGPIQPISNYLPIAKTYAPLAPILPAPLVKPLPDLPPIFPSPIVKSYPIISSPIVKSSPYLQAPYYQTPIVKSNPILQSPQLPLFRTPVIAPPSIPSPIIRPIPLTPPPIAPGQIIKTSPILSEPLFNPVIKSNPISIGEHLNIGQGYLDGLGYDLGKGSALTGLNNYLDNAWMGDKY